MPTPGCSNERELRPAEPEDENEKGEVLDRLWAASDNLAASNIFIDDTPGLSIRELRSKARRLKAAGGAGPDRHRLPAADAGLPGTFRF